MIRTLSRPSRVVAAAALALLAVISFSSAASADVQPPTTSNWTVDAWSDGALDSMVAANPGARRISQDTVIFADGGGVKAAPAAGTCLYRYLCVWKGLGYNGSKLMFWKCEFRNFGAEYPGWSDAIRSYQNHQSGGAVSVFYDWQGRWIEVERTRAIEDIPVERGAGRADGVQVC